MLDIDSGIADVQYEHPIYSKKKVQNSGKALRKDNTEDNVLDIFNNWRSSHALPLDFISEILSSTVKDIDDNYLIAKRLKRSPSIINKLKLQPSMSLASMQDIGGCRAIVSTVDNVYKVSENVKSNLSNHKLICTTDYIKNPKSSGYRSIHQVYRFDGSNISNAHSGLLVELQIRTINQHYWATAVETMGTYLKQSLKSSQGDSKYLNFFSKVGDLFAAYENLPLYHNLSILQLMMKVNIELNILNVFEKLVAFRNITHYIENEIENPEDADYYLIITDSEQHTIRINPIHQSQLKHANSEYTKLEQRFKKSATKDVVLVSAKNLTELRETYPNYFNDIQNFLDLYTLVINTLKKGITKDEYQAYNEKVKSFNPRERKRRLKKIRSQQKYPHRIMRMLQRRYRKTTNISHKEKILVSIEKTRSIILNISKEISMITKYDSSMNRKIK